jgi:hypothetical protein
MDPDPWSAFGLGQLPAAAAGSGRRLLGEAVNGVDWQHSTGDDKRQQGVAAAGRPQDMHTVLPSSPPGQHSQQRMEGRHLRQSGASGSRSGAGWGGDIQGTLTAAEASTSWPTAEEDAARGDNSSWLDRSGSITVTGPVPQFLLPSDKALTGAAQQAAAAVKPGSPAFWILVAVAAGLVVVLLGLACYLCIALRRRRQEEEEEQREEHSPVDDMWGVETSKRSGRVRSRADVVDIGAGGPELLFSPQGRGPARSPGSSPRKQRHSNRRPNSSPDMAASGGARRVPSHNSWVTPRGDPSPDSRAASPSYHR